MTDGRSHLISDAACSDQRCCTSCPGSTSARGSTRPPREVRSPRPSRGRDPTSRQKYPLACRPQLACPRTPRPLPIPTSPSKVRVDGDQSLARGPLQLLWTIKKVRGASLAERFVDDDAPTLHMNTYDIGEVLPFVRSFGDRTDLIEDHRSGGAPEIWIGHPHRWPFVVAERARVPRRGRHR